MRFLLLMCFLACLHPIFTSAAQLEIEDFKTENHFRDVAISPNGQYLATLWNEGFKRTVIVQDMFQGGKKIATFGNIAVRPNWLSWANNERLLVNISIPLFKDEVIRDAKDNKDFNFYEHPHVQRIVSFKPDGSDYKKLMAREKRVRFSYSLSGIYHKLPEQKDIIQITARIKGKLTLFDVNIETGKSKIVEKGGQYTYAFYSDKQGNLLYRLDWIKSEQSILIYDYDDGDWIQKERFDSFVEDQTQAEVESFGGVLTDGSVIYRKVNEKTGYYELLKRDRSGKTSVFISYPDRDVINTLRTDGNEVIGHVIEENDVIRYRYLDENRQKEYESITKQLTLLGVSYFNYASRHDNSDLSVLRSNGPDDPGGYYIHQKSTNQLIFYSFGHKTLIPDNLGIPAVVSYKARDKQMIKAYMLLPNNYQKGQKYPMVMLPHGGPHSRDYAYYDTLAQFLATRGYVVMQPNFRGSTGYGKAFEAAGYKQWGGVMREDIEDGVKYAIRTGIVDPDKVCIAGISYGGYAALMGALNQDKLYQCAISMNGVSHIPKHLAHQDYKFRSSASVLQRIYERYGHYKEDRKLLESQSPALRADEVSVPILLIGGEQDDIVSFEQQEVMEKALRKAKKEYEVIELEDTYHHPYSNRENMQKVFSAIETFLAQHLG